MTCQRKKMHCDEIVISEMILWMVKLVIALFIRHAESIFLYQKSVNDTKWKLASLNITKTSKRGAQNMQTVIQSVWNEIDLFRRKPKMISKFYTCFCRLYGETKEMYISGFSACNQSRPRRSSWFHFNNITGTPIGPLPK